VLQKVLSVPSSVSEPPESRRNSSSNMIKHLQNHVLFYLGEHFLALALSCCSTTLSSSSEGRKQPKNPLMCVLETTRFKASGASKRSLSSLKRWSRRNSAARNLLSCKWPITKSGQDGSSQLDSLHTAQATS